MSDPDRDAAARWRELMAEVGDGDITLDQAQHTMDDYRDISYAGAKDGMAYTEEHFEDPSYNQHIARGQVIIMSIGLDDIGWFEAHCPEWREHVSFRKYSAERAVDEMLMAAAEAPAIILSTMRRDLVTMIVESILDRMEIDVSIL